MTITETRAEAASVAGPPDVATTGGLAGWLTTGDHKRIGRLYIVVSFVFVAAALVISFLLDVARTDPTGDIFSTRLSGQLFSLTGLSLALLGVLPLLLGVAIYVVPLQVGARTIAFPRAAAASLWAWLTGAVLMIASFAANGGPGGGRGKAVALFFPALGLVVVGLLAGALCVATTVLTLRAPGMALEKVPVFAWSALVQSVLVLLSLPVLLANLIYLYVDFRYRRIYFGGATGISQHIAWATGQPEVYLYAVPVLGFMAEVAAVFAGIRLKLQPVVLGAIGLFGVLGFGAFAQPTFQPNYGSKPLNVLINLAAPLPVLVVLAACALTLRSGRPRLAAPLVFGVTAMLALLVGTGTGAFTYLSDLHLVGTVWHEAHFALVVFAGVLAGLGALAYWGPKMWGRSFPDRGFIGLAVLGLLALALYAIPQLINGAIHQPALLLHYTKGNRALNGVAAAGAILLAFVLVGALGALLRAARRGGESGADPWHGHTLEWATTSPPPPGNFAQPVGEVHSDRPLLDREEPSR